MPDPSSGAVAPGAARLSGDLSDRIIGAADPALLEVGQRFWQVLSPRRNAIELVSAALLVAGGWWLWTEASEHGHRVAVIAGCLPAVFIAGHALRRRASPQAFRRWPERRWTAAFLAIELALAGAIWWLVQREGIGWSVLLAPALLPPLTSLLAGPIRLVNRVRRASSQRRQPDLARADLALALAQSDEGPVDAVLEAWLERQPPKVQAELRLTSAATSGHGHESVPSTVSLRRSVGDAWIQADLAAARRGRTLTLTTSDGFSALIEPPSQLAKRHGWNETHARTVAASLLTGGPVLVITAPDARWAGHVQPETVLVTRAGGLAPRRSHTDLAQHPGPYRFAAKPIDGPGPTGVRILPPFAAGDAPDAAAASGEPPSSEPSAPLASLLRAIAEQPRAPEFTTTPLRDPAELEAVRLTTAGVDPRHVDLTIVDAEPEPEVLVSVPDLGVRVRYPMLHGEWFRAPVAVAALLARAERPVVHDDGARGFKFGPTTI